MDKIQIRKLKKLVANLSLNNAILKDALGNKIVSPDRRCQAVQ
jgi:hypothetical protein